MSCPSVDTPRLVRLLEPPSGPCDVVIDSDTYNEIDDQFAILHALLSDNLNVEAIYAAPFHNVKRATSGPAEGMEMSYQEVLKILELSPIDFNGTVLRGAKANMRTTDDIVDSPAAADLVRRAMADRDGPLYVLALGAATNVSSALLMEPRIKERIVIVPLGGKPYEFPSYEEFNFKQDVHAVKAMFDSGAAIIHVPAYMVSEAMRTTEAELNRYVKGRGAIGDYLYQLYHDWVPDEPGKSKPIWDLAPGAFLMNPAWSESRLTASPIMNENMLHSFDSARHPVRVLTRINRDSVFVDFFDRLHRATAIT